MTRTASMEIQGRGEVRDKGQLDLVTGRMWWVRERGKSTVSSSALIEEGQRREGLRRGHWGWPWRKH